MKKTYLYIGLGAGVLMLLGVGWFTFFRGSPQTPVQQTASFPSEGTVTTTVTPQGGGGDTTNTPLNAQNTSAQTVFKIADGPVVAATFIQTTNPTTTIVRYIMQENAHIFDLTLDSPGAVARSTSNTTVPGIAQAQWAQGGQTALLQYLEGSTVKTLSLTPPPVSTSSLRASPQMRFLPDGITGVAFSPDGKSVAYLLKGASGADGYTAAADGSSPKKLFSLPLSQFILSWPSPGTILLYTKSAAGVPGVLFSVAVNSGTVTPLLYAEGLTVLANKDLSKLIYQNTLAGAGSRATFVRNIKTGTNSALSFTPYPEKCTWSTVLSEAVYCAVPLAYTAADYLDAWHQGTQSAADSLVGFNLSSGHSAIFAVPGSTDGGVKSDILSLGISPGDKYLLFIKKDDRSLWGVRLQ